MSTTTLHHPPGAAWRWRCWPAHPCCWAAAPRCGAEPRFWRSSPVRASAIGDDGHVMLDGHDVVAYFTEGRHARASRSSRASPEGVTFHFASAAHKALFDAAPQKYLPQYGGFCANGIMPTASPGVATPTPGASSTASSTSSAVPARKDAFLLDVPGNRKLADQYWATEVAGSNSFWQRSKRLVFRVPHYASGEELAPLLLVMAGQERTLPHVSHIGSSVKGDPPGRSSDLYESKDLRVNLRYSMAPSTCPKNKQEGCEFTDVNVEVSLTQRGQKTWVQLGSGICGC
jgi:YHS domain-containing protein